MTSDGVPCLTDISSNSTSELKLANTAEQKSFDFYKQSMALNQGPLRWHQLFLHYEFVEIPWIHIIISIITGMSDLLRCFKLSRNQCFHAYASSPFNFTLLLIKYVWADHIVEFFAFQYLPRNWFSIGTSVYHLTKLLGKESTLIEVFFWIQTRELGGTQKKPAQNRKQAYDCRLYRP